MNILSALQIKQADLYTIAHEPIASIDLMERAARACLFRILKHSDDETQFYIFCGKGNNGGDGLAIARMLIERNRRVVVCVVEHSDKCSEDFHLNMQRLLANEKTIVQHIHQAADIHFQVSENALIIDAVLGTGINKPASGLIADTISALNASLIPIIAIDIPSGLLPDNENDHKQPIVCANTTLTFQQPKLAFMFAENALFVGQFEVLDIGLNEDFISQQDSPFYYLNKRLVAGLLKPRAIFSHKGLFGHALVIAGSYGKTGAAVLAAKACLKSGAGLLTVHIPHCSHTILQTALPEAMVNVDPAEHCISALPDLTKYKAIGIGPGIGTEKQTQNCVKLAIQNSPVPLVIDADAINILAENKTWLAFLPAFSILTPHPKEFDRLAGAHSSAFSRLQSAIELARKHKIIIVLKGAHTALVMPDGHVFFNSTGNPALAKGGSGDVLTGMITGLLARGYAPNHAAIIGVYLHGLTADIVIKKINPESVLASDIVDKIGKAFDKLNS